MVAVGGCGASLLVFIEWAFKSSDAYTKSLAAVRADPQVQAVLGEPMEPGLLVTGHISVNSSGGYARIAYNVSGPEGAGTVYVVAYKEAGQWVFQTLAIKVKATGERIDVPTIQAPAEELRDQAS